MKGVLLVLFDRKTTQLDSALQEMLAPHRLDENAELLPRFYWDYWLLTEEPFGGVKLDTRDLEPTAQCNPNVCLLAELPSDYIPSAVITPDGHWHDLSESGWRLTNESSDANHQAMARWRQTVAQLRVTFADCLGIEVLYHC